MPSPLAAAPLAALVLLVLALFACLAVDRHAREARGAFRDIAIRHALLRDDRGERANAMQSPILDRGAALCADTYS